MKRRHVAVLMLCLPLAALVVGVLLVMLMPDWLDRMLVQQLSERMSGQLDVRIAPRSLAGAPALELTDLRWTPDHAQPGHIAVDRVLVSTPWSADPAGVRQLSMVWSGGQVELHQRADGQWIAPAWMDDGTAPAAATGAPVELESLRLEHIALRLIPYASAPVELTVNTGAIDADDAGWLVRFDAAGRRGDLNLGGQGTAHFAIDGAMALNDVRFAGELTVAALKAVIPELHAETVRIDDGHLGLSGLAGQLRLPQQGGVRPLELSFAVPELSAGSGRWAAQLERFEAGLAGPMEARLHLTQGVLEGDEAGIGLAPLAVHVEVRPDFGPVSLETQGGTLHYGYEDARLTLSGVDFSGQVPDPADPADPDAGVAVSGQVSGTLVTADASARLRVTAQAEGSRAEGTLVHDPAAQPGWRVEARVDRLDLDRWTPPESPQSSEGVPLDIWRNWPVQLDLRVGELNWNAVRIRDAQLRLGGAE